MKREITDWETEGKRFNQVATIYDKYRPSYPNELIERIIITSGIKKEDKIIEVGAGSGKATELFVQKGFKLTCIEPGENLARIGSERFKEFGKVEYIVTRFEEWDGLGQIYDLAISAQAFHWVPKPVGYKKLAEALKENKYIALFWNMYVNYDNEFVNELAAICKEYSVIWMDKKEEIDNRISDIKQDIIDSNYFSEVQVYEYPWEIEDTCEDFINFLRTGNGYIGLSDEFKLEFDRQITDVFNRAGGRIKRRFNCVLFLSKKLKFIG